MTMKITALFSVAAVGRGQPGGFSETFYIASGSPSAALAIAAQYGAKRVRLSPSNVSFQATRATVVDAPGQSIVERESGAVGLYGTPDISKLGVMATLQTTEGLKRQMIFRCMPDEFIVNESWNPSTAWVADYTDLRNFIISNQLKLRGNLRANTPQPYLSIDSNGHVQFSVSPPFSAGNNVRFFRSYDQNGQLLKGDWNVSSVNGSSNYMVLFNWPNTRLAGPGKIRKFNIDYYNITGVTPAADLIPRTRKLGRPFDSQVGRRRAA